MQIRFVMAWLVLVTLGGGWWTVQAEPARRAPLGRDTTWTLAAVGDAIITRRVSPFNHDGDPGFRDLVRLLRGADAAVVNLELSLFRFSEFRGWAEVENGGNWEVGPPEGAGELKDMGFLLMSRANNHATDYGVEGMRVTDALLDRLGIVHAGSGENLGLASRPGYLDTARGRIALISLATTFTPMSRAGASRPDMGGRPGINALRVHRKYEADPATLAQLRALAARFGAPVTEPAVPTGSDATYDPSQSAPPLASARPTATAGDPRAPVRLLGVTVEPAERTRTVETLDARDEERIIKEIRNAASLADFVLVTSHTHEPDNLEVTPPAWLVGFARRCIDAGATAFIAHGPHQLRGLEIYHGRPIFFSLGNFIFQNETIDPMPQDMYDSQRLPDTALAADVYDAKFKGGTRGFPTRPAVYESVVALPTFRHGQMISLRLVPIEMGRTSPRSQRGTPRIADEATGRAIITRLQRLSAPFGTTIEYHDGAGWWRPAPRQGRYAPR